MTTLDKTSIPSDNKPKEANKPVMKDSTAASLARAEARLREIRQNLPEGGALRDKFWAPDAPPGFTYEWKVRTVLNEEQSS